MAIARYWYFAYNCPVMPTNYKNILIIKPSSLGDIVLALPALSVLRRSFPDANISWLVRPEFAPLLENHPYLDEIILFERKLLGKAWYRPGAFASLISLIRRLRKGKFDLVLDFQGLFRSASLCRLSGCRSRFGMACAREMAHIFYTVKVSQNLDCVHLVDYYLEIVRMAGADKLDVEFVLPGDATATESVGRLLTDYDIAAGDYVFFVPGSAHWDKCWPLENFAELAEKIKSVCDIAVVAVGTASEKDLVEKLKNLASVPIINFAGKTGIKELVELLRQSRFVVSNDTGPGHIPAALNVPAVLIFGRSNPARVAPYKKNICVAAVEPWGRGLATDSSDPGHDIRKITVDMVFEKFLQQMQ